MTSLNLIEIDVKNTQFAAYQFPDNTSVTVYINRGKKIRSAQQDSVSRYPCKEN